MSGIAGILNLDASPVSLELLHALTQFLTFRGPDAQRMWCEGFVGFAHTLLRTTPETGGGEQPANLDGEFWITADARIDARAELIDELHSKGSTATSADSDHQLILHAYRAWGAECVEHLLGDFSFAIWDGPERRLFCARDHFGVKPFFYTRVGGALIFSNALNCLRICPGVSAKLNDRAIADFLLFDSNQDMATTAFSDILRLPPAHTLECNGETLLIRRYWTLPAPAENEHKRSEENVEHFNELLDTAVRDRLRAETAGVLMSGGLDSSTVAATAQRLFVRAGFPSGLQAYTLVFDRLIPDEERYFAGLAAHSLGIPIHYRSADNLRLFDVFDNPRFSSPEPVHAAWGTLSGDQLREISARSRVALTGLGADPALSSSLPSHFRSLLRNRRYGRALTDVVSFLSAEGRFSRLYFKTRWRHSFKAKEERPWFPPWLNPDLTKRLGIHDRWNEIESQKTSIESVRPGAYELTSGSSWTTLFESYDPGVTRVPIEVRHPFFDLRLLNFLLGLPALPLCSDKELLRRSALGKLCDEVRLRRKSPLLSDPLLVLLQKPESAWVDSFAPSKDLENFVVRSCIPPVFGANDAWTAWIHLRPLSLNFWLQRHSSLS